MTRRRLAPAWLTARPIAHRGLHGAPTGFVENSLPAAAAAIEADYAIECDVQISRDGEAMVFHDLGLERLTRVEGKVAERTAAQLADITYGGGSGAIAPLPAFLASIAGRVPVIVEVKSAFDGDLRLAARAAAIVAGYRGQAALKSFDPAIVAHLRAADPVAPVGLVAQADIEVDAPPLPADAFLRDVPDFLSWRVDDLPHRVPTLCRTLGLPVVSWTVRTPAQRALAARFADQIVFEGFRA